MIKKIFKILGLMLLIFIILLLIHSTRNFIIISKLQNNILKYKNSTNFHVSIVSNEPNDVIVKTNYYKKDNKEALFLEHTSKDENSKISLYKNNEKTNMYIDSTEGKNVELDTDDMLMHIDIYNTLESESKLQTFLSSIFTHIKSEADNYIISNFESTLFMQPAGKQEYYINKETGLLSKSIINGLVAERKYEFNSVSDNIFIEPDINEYIPKNDSKEEINNNINPPSDTTALAPNNTSTTEKVSILSYYSADRNAVIGDPITIDIYKLDNNEFEFKYHAVWNENDIEGTAKKVQGNLYVYEDNFQKIEFLFDSIGENSFGVTEFDLNDHLTAQINLFK